VLRLQEGADQESQRKKDPRARVRPLYDIPYMFEAREFLRKKLIGKKVTIYVTGYYVQNVYMQTRDNMEMEKKVVDDKMATFK